jgi:hypothetical protein
MAKTPKDIAASGRQRLLNLARQQGHVFDVVVVAFGLERLVYRLSVSDYRDRFVLTGGMLVTLWTADTGRFTRDIDFLAFGSDEEAKLKEAFSAILAIDGGDGLIYDATYLTAAVICEDRGRNWRPMPRGCWRWAGGAADGVSRGAVSGQREPGRARRSAPQDADRGAGQWRRGTQCKLAELAPRT